MFKKRDSKARQEKANTSDSNKKVGKGEGKNAQTKPPKKRKETKPYDATLNISPAKGSTKNKKRKGMGTASGLGKTAGRGQKGQKSRSGGGVRVGFEGGQMPLQRRIPKRGFVNIFKENFTLVNLVKLKKFNDNEEINREILFSKGMIASKKNPLKLLGIGDLDKPLTIYVNKASKSAIEKVEKAGGKVVILEEKVARKKGVKKEKTTKLPRKEKKVKKKIESLNV